MYILKSTVHCWYDAVLEKYNIINRPQGQGRHHEFEGGRVNALEGGRVNTVKPLKFEKGGGA